VQVSAVRVRHTREYLRRAQKRIAREQDASEYLPDTEASSIVIHGRVYKLLDGEGEIRAIPRLLLFMNSNSESNSELAYVAFSVQRNRK
jgi:hypothetical protein